jgi:hypothetical protein
MKQYLRRSALLGIGICVCSPAWAAKPPKWVNGADPAYPASTYISGVGVGKDLDSARASARAEISKVLQAKVAQTAVDTQTESSASVGDKRGVSSGTLATKTQTAVTTESLLEGVVIAQTWTDKKSGATYALALLDKSKTRQALSQQIMDLEERIAQSVNQSKVAATPVEKARSLSTAQRLAVERDILSSRRRVVDPAVIPDVGSAETSASIAASLEEALRRIQFTVDADGGEDSRLGEAVTGRINDMGFKVIPAKEAAKASGVVLAIRCTLSLEPFDRGNPQWTFFMWKGTFEMAEAGAGGKVLASSAPSGTDGHIKEAAARIKTRESGEAALAQEAQNQIGHYIFGE